MIKFVLFSPFHLLRQVVLYCIYLIVLLIVLFYFLASSPLLFKIVGEKFAPDYNVTYTDISGTLIDGVEVKNLTYHNYPILDNLRLKLNLTTLLGKKVTIKELGLRGLNVDSLKNLLPTKTSKEDTNKNRNEPMDNTLPIAIEIDKLHLDLKPFIEHNLTIKHSSIDLENISGDKAIVSIKDITLKVGIVSTKNRINLLAPLKKSEINLSLLKSKIDIQKVMIAQSRFNLGVLTNMSNLFLSGDIKNNRLFSSLLLHPKKPLFTYYKLPLNQDRLGDIECDINASKDEVRATLNKSVKKILVADKKAFNIDINRLFSMLIYDMNHSKLLVKSSLNIDTPYGDGIRIENRFIFDKNISYNGTISLDKVLGVKKRFVAPLENLHISYQGDDKHINSTLSSKLLSGRFDSKNFKEGEISFETKKSLLLSQMIKLPLELNTTQVNLKVESVIPFVEDKPIVVKSKIDSNIVNINLNLKYQDSIKLDSKIKMVKNSLLQNYNKDFAWKKLKPFDLSITSDKIERGKPLILKAKVASNLIDLKTDVRYKEEDLSLKSKISISKKSLLYGLNQSIKWKNIAPLKIVSTLKKQDLKLNVNTPIIGLNTKYDLNSTKLSTNFVFDTLHMDIKGKTDDKLVIKTEIHSIDSMIKSINKIYPFKMKSEIKGDVKVDVEIEKLKKFFLKLALPTLTYQGEDKVVQKVDNIVVNLGYEDNNLSLNSYSLLYQEQKIFSTKPSFVVFEKDKIKITPLWINDALKMQGEYELQSQKGNIITYAKSFNIEHKLIDLGLSLSLNTLIDKGSTDVQGKITLLGGRIYYDLATKTFASDSDILVVQEMQKEQGSPFMDKLSSSIEIKSEKPLLYQQGDINIKAGVDLTLFKAKNSELSLFGSIELKKGGSYTFEDKKFILKESFVHFTGDPNKPLLDIGVTYKSLNHLITIGVSGSPTAPNITFSSKPSLTREQILSIILFDSDGAAGTNTGEDMMKMMGGAMAKSALSNVGVKLDHLVIGENNSVEVGKKLTHKLTFIYINDIVSSIKLKYQHGRRTESVIGASEESQSYDIIYKVDFNNLLDAF